MRWLLSTAMLLGCTAILPIPIEDDGGVDDARAVDVQTFVDAGPRPDRPALPGPTDARVPPARDVAPPPIPDAARPDGPPPPPPPAGECFDEQGYRACTGLLTWHEARAACRAADMDLAILSSWEENAEVWRRLGQSGQFDYWIGFHDQDVEGRFVDVEGRPPAIDAWGEGEPNDLNGEDCVLLHAWSPRWNDADCDTRLPFVCEVERRAPDDERCTQRDRMGRRYAFCNYPTSWPEARQRCGALGMDLAVLDSPPENRWAWQTARDLADTDWWVGLSDQGQEGDWQWIDGRRPSFHGWSPGQPDDRGDEDCGMLWSMGDADGRWNDGPCWAGVRFICER